MRQETFIERFKRRIKTKRYRLWLLNRILIWAMATMVLFMWITVIGYTFNDDQEAAPQVTETPAVESQAPEVSVEVPAEPIPEEVPEEPVPVEPSPEVKTVLVYDVPLDLELQLHIIQVCEDYHIAPSIVIAMIERETQFDADAIGDNCHSFGLMQIQQKWHQKRMDKLGVTDLMDPYQNVLVGIDYLAELCGMQNAFADIEGWQSVSQEQVIERNPDYIVLVTGMGEAAPDEVKARDGWGEMDAIKNDAIFNADSYEMTRPAPRLKDAAISLYNFLNGIEAE